MLEKFIVIYRRMVICNVGRVYLNGEDREGV